MRKPKGLTTRTTLLILLTASFLLAACTPTPAFQDGDSITWQQAVEVLNGGDVTMIFQTHDLAVTLTLEDGSQLHTVEPTIDAIFAEVEACGVPCDDIVLATE